MIELAGITFLRPPWLFALIVVAATGFLLARRASGLAGWQRAIDPPLLAALGRLGRVVPGTGRRNWLPVATGALIAIALAGPARESRDGATFRNLDGLVIAIDLSRSVTEGGYLAEARTAARLVAARAATRPVALVVYAGDAYLASAFTTDASALGTTIAVLDGKTVPDIGSRPARGLALARRTLEDAAIVAGDVVLVSDGGGITRAAYDEAAAIVAAGGRVSSLFVPARALPEDAPAPDRGALEALAQAGEGVAGDVLEPFRVAEEAGARPASRLGAAEFAALVWTDYGRYLLVLALLPALALFRRRP